MKVIAVAAALLAISVPSATASMRLCTVVFENNRLNAETRSLVIEEVSQLRGTAEQPVMDRIFRHFVSTQDASDRQLTEISSICLEIIGQTVDQLRESTPQ